MPLSSQELLDPLRGALARLLGELAPGNLQDCFFISNGTDAVEGAMKLARLYTGKPGFISCIRGFHGKSYGSLSLMGKAEYRLAFGHWDVVPDIMCLGKALGGGVMPLSAFMSTPEIWKVLEPNPFIHSSTFGGNPLACAAGIAAVNVTLEEDLPGQAAATGEYLMAELRKLQRQYSEHLMEVRGLGLLIGLEFVDTE